MLNAQTMTEKKKPSQYYGVQTQVTLKDYVFHQLRGNYLFLRDERPKRCDKQNI